MTIVNHSNIVGKPVGDALPQPQRLGRRSCTSSARTCRPRAASADVLIRAAPVQGLIKGDMVKPGAVVVDVTTIRVDGKQVGSLDWEPVCAVAAQVTPVPGGVGPVTNVILLKNALAACKAQIGAR